MYLISKGLHYGMEIKWSNFFLKKTLCDKRCIDIVQHAILLQFVLVLICSNYIAIDLSPTFGSTTWNDHDLNVCEMVKRNLKVKRHENQKV